MAKGKGKGKAAAQGAQPATAVAPVITVLPTKVALRGARAAWYAHLCACNGQTAAQFAAAALAAPPSTPAKGKLAGQCEPPAGWLRWFAANGFCTLGAPPAQ